MGCSGSVFDTDTEATQSIESNDGASEALPDIFENRVILSHILEQLPNSKLLELSLVSKLWKKEARNVMKKRGNVMALLNSDGATGCGQVFQNFAANLETLDDALYSGMTIRLNSVVDCEGTEALEVERIHESILAGMKGKLKLLSIGLEKSQCLSHAQDCPSFLLLRLLLRDFIVDLENLTLEIEGTFENIVEQFIQEYLPDGPYPKLKVLKLKDVDCTSNQETFGNQIRLLLSRAPNLQEIHTYGRVSLMENLMEAREGVVHVHESYVDNPLRDIPENVLPALRLKRIKLIYNPEQELDFDRFNIKAEILLRTCCATTLEWLQLNTLSAHFFMSYGIRLVYVNDLRIDVDYLKFDEFEKRIFRSFSRIDFTYLFPNLKKVYIRYIGKSYLGESSTDSRNVKIEVANALPILPLNLFQTGNIKFFELHHNSIQAYAVRFFADMFPAIEELEVMGPEEDIPVGSVWELWPNLKWVSINGKRFQRPSY